MKTVAIVLAAGKGTRMTPHSSGQVSGEGSPIPKVMFKVLGKPLIGYVMDALKETEVDEIIPIVGYKKEMVEEYVDGKHRFAVQEEQKGTGHAVAMAREMVEGNFETVLVTCGDMPLITTETFNKVLDAHKSEQPAVTVLSAIYSGPTGYGRIIRDQDGNVEGIVEDKDCTEEQKTIKECNTATYAFNSDWLWKNIDKIDNHNAQGEIYLTDLVHLAREEGEKIVAVSTDEHQAHGVNNPEQLKEAEEILVNNQ